MTRVRNRPGVRRLVRLLKIRETWSGRPEVEILTDDVFKEHASGERPVKHLGEGELGLQDRDVIAIPSLTVATRERVRQGLEPLAGQRVDLPGAQPVTDPLQTPRVLTPSKAVIQRCERDARVGGPRPMGSPWLADRLWERLEIGKVIIDAAGGRRLEAQAVERAIFAMVANRMSVRRLSKLAGCGWVAERAFIEGLAEVSDDACYRAMDFLHAALPELQERVFFTVASLLDLEVDLLFFDTSSTYWETDRLPEEL